MPTSRRLLPSLTLAALALSPSTSDAGVLSASQIDAGLYDIETTDGGGVTTPSGWVEVHDHVVAGVPERHEHWYVNGSWKPDAQKITFKYHQAPLGHGRSPAASTGHTHYGFLVVRAFPTGMAEVAPPGTSAPATCADAHLCPTFHTLKDAKGETFGYANVWVVAGKTQELYFLDPTKFKPPSPAACNSVWSLGRHDAALPPVASKPTEKVAATGTLTWDNRLAQEGGGASGDRGATAVNLAVPPAKCPP